MNGSIGMSNETWWNAIGRHGLPVWCRPGFEGAGDLSFGATVGAIGVGFLFALAIAAYLFYRLFPVFFGTPLLGVLKK